MQYGRVFVVGAGALALVLSTAVCGYTDAGSGSNSLRVLAELVYQSVPADRTEAMVTVHDSNDYPVSAASVTFVAGDDTGASYTAEPVAQVQGARYRVVLDGYIRRVELKVRGSGRDYLDGRLEGPGRHTVASPRAKDFVPLEDLRVRWNTDDGLRADEVELRLEEADVTRITRIDSGETTFEASQLRTGTEVLHIVRRNWIDLEGGLTGSRLQISYHEKVEFQVEK